jgi:hypothetical protein
MLGVLLFSFLSACSATSSNINAVLDIDYLNDFVSKTLPLIEALISNIPIGNFTYSTSLGFINVTVDLENIVAQNTAAEMVFIAPEEPKYGLLHLIDVSTDLVFEYDLKLGATNTGGHGSLAISKTNLTTALNIEAVDGTAQLELQNTTFEFGAFNLTTELEPDLEALIVQLITAELPLIHDLVVSYVNTNLTELVNPILANWVYQFPINNTDLVIDYSLTDSSIISDLEFATVFLNGTIFDSLIPKVYEGKRTELPAYSTTLAPALQLLVNDWAVNNLVLNLWRNIDFTITEIPASLGIDLKLDTDTLAILLPQLRSYFGRKKPVAIRLYQYPIAGAPELVLNKSIYTKAKFATDFLCDPNGRGYEDSIGFLWSVELELTASLNATSIHAAIKKIELNELELLFSVVGNVNVSLVKTLISDVLKAFLPNINKLISNIEVTLPTIPFLSIKRDQLEINEGFIEAAIELGFGI